MSNSKMIGWFAWLIASTFYAYQYIIRVMPNILLTDIMQQFNIDAAIFGQFSGAYYIGYCLMHLPIGIMLDRYGPKNIMSISILLTVCGLIPTIYAEHWISLVMGRFLIGVGSSAAILGIFKIIRMVFSEENFTRMLSFSVTIGLIGAIYGGEPVSYLCDVYGYKAVVQIFAIVGLVLSAITYVFVPSAKGEHKTTMISDLKAVFTNKRVILVCCLAGFMVGPLEGFADAWGSEFLKETYKIDSTRANYLISMIYIGMCFAPVLSYIAQKTRCYNGTIVGAGIFMLISFTILLMQKFNPNFMVFAFFIVGICCAYQILAIYKASTYVHENISGLTAAVANMIIMSFGYVFHSVIGVLVQAFGVYGKEMAFIYGVSFVPIMLLIGIVGFSVISYQDSKAVSKSF